MCSALLCIALHCIAFGPMDAIQQKAIQAKDEWTAQREANALAQGKDISKEKDSRRFKMVF